jgi:hypothetical protein
MLLLIVATLQHFLQAVGFSNILLTVSIFRHIPKFSKYDFRLRHVCLSVCLYLCTKLLDSDCEDDNTDISFKTTRKTIQTFDFFKFLT